MHQVGEDEASVLHCWIWRSGGGVQDLAGCIYRGLKGRENTLIAFCWMNFFSFS